MNAREKFPHLAALLVNGKAPQRILDDAKDALDLLDRLERELNVALDRIDAARHQIAQLEELAYAPVKEGR